MGTFSNKKSTLLLVILLTSAALLINPTQASAKADFYDSDEDWVSWYTEEDWTTSEGDEDTHSDSGIGGNVEPKSVGTQDSQFYHSNHQHIIHTAGVFNSSPEVPNQAVFNENCSPTVKCHNPDNLVCSATDGTGKCVCKEGYVYLRHTESCSVIPKLDQEICKYDIQCHERNWGKISRCSKVSMRCECYDYLSNGRQDTGLIEGVCYIKKSVGAPCNTSDECHGHIRGETYCKPGDRYLVGGIQCTIINGEIQCPGGTCQCKDTHLWFKPLSECLLLATKPGDACKVNEQCMKSSLGKLSRCETSSATCKCGSPRSNEADIPDSFFYEPLSRCVCKEGYVYVRQTETCWVIPKSDQDPCAHDVQCHEGKWGKISRCNKYSARCECFDSRRRITVLADGVCYIMKSFGDLCNTNEECGHIAGEPYCKPGDHDSAGGVSYNGSCQCRDTHFLRYKDNPFFICLLLPNKPGDACKVHEQCMNSSLGRYSRCETSSATCKCGPPRANEAEIPESIFYEPLNQCFLKKAYNDTCEEKDECVANLGPGVECGKTEDYPEMNTCHCPGERVCGSRRVERPHIELGGRNNAFKVVPSSGSWIISDALIGIMTLAMNGVGMGLASRY